MISLEKSLNVELESLIEGFQLNESKNNKLHVLQRLLKNPYHNINSNWREYIYRVK